MAEGHALVLAAGIAVSVALLVVAVATVGRCLLSRGLPGTAPVLVLDDAEAAYDPPDADNPLI